MYNHQVGRLCDRQVAGNAHARADFKTQIAKNSFCAPSLPSNPPCSSSTHSQTPSSFNRTVQLLFLYSIPNRKFTFGL